MLHTELLNILRCPDDHSKLTLAPSEMVQRINNAIRNGQVTSRGGQTVEETIHAGLIREDGKYLYPIIDDIPVLLRDDAIALDQFSE